MGTITLTERDRSVLRVLADAPASSERLAGEVEYSTSDLAERLQELAENGLLWERDDGTYALTESGSRALETPMDRSGDSRIDASDHLREAIAALDLRPERAEAVFDAVAFLRYWGEASESELIDGIYSEKPGGYESTDEWWQLFMRDTLAALPDIDPPTEDTDSDSWQYTAAEIEEHTEDGRSRFDGPTQSYGSVKHALEVLDLPNDQHTAVHAVFAVLCHNKTAAETELKRTSYEEGSPDMSADAWWSQRIEPVLRELPGIEQQDEQTWEYTGDTTDHTGAADKHDETLVDDTTATQEMEANDLCPVCQQPYDGRAYIEASETRLSGWAVPICIKATAAETPSGADITLYYHESTDDGR